MKVFFKSICVAMVITILFSLVPFEGECKEISDQILRVHILANSDTDADQNLKLKVRDAVIASAEKLFSDVHSKEQAIEVTEKNLSYLIETAQQVIYDEGYDYVVTGEVKRLFFDTRYYSDVTMPAGVYDALQLKIGNAEGKNWWCVMYPSLCLYSACESDTLSEKLSSSQYEIVTSQGGYKFRFRIVELFNTLCNLISD